MFVIGAGFGLLASQLGNVNMSAVSKEDTSEVGGLQGTFQNLGSSFGTAIVGSVFILLLGSGFAAAVQTNDKVTPEVQSQVTQVLAEQGVPIISQAEAEQIVLDAGADPAVATAVAQDYADSQVEALKQALFIVFALLAVSLMLARNLPAEVVAKPEEEEDASRSPRPPDPHAPQALRQRMPRPGRVEASAVLLTTRSRARAPAGPCGGSCPTWTSGSRR